MGPLAGIRVLEFAGLGTVPFAAMLLADMGATVVRISRPPRRVGASHWGDPHRQAIDRGRQSIILDLARQDGRDVALRLVSTADVLIEGMRPDVMERLGLGPDACLAVNPRLVYGRVTGWGRRGPLAARAGHDINFIALAGALHAIGRAGQPPTPPPALVGDFAAGAMQIVIGILAALLEVRRSGRGQAVDASMLQGAATLMTPFYAALSSGRWRDERGTNLVDSGAPYYDSYLTADDRWIAIGANEPAFFARLLAAVGIADFDPRRQFDRAAWPELRRRLAGAFRGRTRDEWERAFEGLDVCAAPVLALAEAPMHPHNQAAGLFMRRDGTWLPSPMLDFARTPGEAGPAAPVAGQHTRAILVAAGYLEPEIERLIADGAAAEAAQPADDQGRTP